MNGRKLRLLVALSTLVAGFVLVLLGATSAGASPAAPVDPVGVVAPDVPAQHAAVTANPPKAPIPPSSPLMPSGCPCNSHTTAPHSSPAPTVVPPTSTTTVVAPTPVVTSTTAPLSNTGTSHIGGLLGTGVGLVALGSLVLVATRRRSGAH